MNAFASNQIEWKTEIITKVCVSIGKSEQDKIERERNRERRRIRLSSSVVVRSLFVCSFTANSRWCEYILGWMNHSLWPSPYMFVSTLVSFVHMWSNWHRQQNVLCYWKLIEAAAFWCGINCLWRNVSEQCYGILGSRLPHAKPFTQQNWDFVSLSAKFIASITNTLSHCIACARLSESSLCLSALITKQRRQHKNRRSNGGLDTAGWPWRS